MRSRRAVLLALLALTLTACTDSPDEAPTRPDVQSPTTTAAAADSQGLAAARPTRLSLPSIDGGGPVDPVRTDPDGTQAVPDDARRVGWWSPGARPGQPGSVALVGHTRATGGGVFDRLGELQVGDRVRVETSERTWSYTVRDVRVVPVDEFGEIAADVYRTDGSPVLTLMTCGDFDGRDFTSTVVVVAEPSSAELDPPAT